VYVGGQKDYFCLYFKDKKQDPSYPPPPQIPAVLPPATPPPGPRGREGGRESCLYTIMWCIKNYIAGISKQSIKLKFLMEKLLIFLKIFNSARRRVVPIYGQERVFRLPAILKSIVYVIETFSFSLLTAEIHSNSCMCFFYSAQARNNLQYVVCSKVVRYLDTANPPEVQIFSRFRNSYCMFSLNL
jgi:hypothetical protein